MTGLRATSGNPPPGVTRALSSRVVHTAAGHHLLQTGPPVAPDATEEFLRRSFRRRERLSRLAMGALSSRAMRYEPPSEAHSYILQATIGCSWNNCTYCWNGCRSDTDRPQAG